MTDHTDRSAEALLARRALAEKATPGPWKRDKRLLKSLDGIGLAQALRLADELYIAANSPDLVMADIDEILLLRTEVQRLEKEADWLATAAANGGWHGERVSPEWMRDAARKACEEQK